MPDTVDVQVIYGAASVPLRRYVVRLTNISDGTGENAVVKVDRSTLRNVVNLEPTRLVVEELAWNVQGFSSVRLFWDHNTDDEVDILSGIGYRDYREHGGLPDPLSAGGTGDLILTTAGAVGGAVYDITIHLRLD